MMRKTFIILGFLALTLFLDTNFCLAMDLPSHDDSLEKAIVTKIISEKHDKELEKIFDSEQIIQILNIKILSGEMKNKEVKVKNYLTNNPEYDIKIKEGDRVIIENDTDEDADDQKIKSSEEKDDDDTEDKINITAKDNSPIILFASGLFLLALLLIGGYRGLQTLMTLIFAGGLIAFVLIPAILTGVSVIPVAIGVAVCSAVFGIFITNGFNLKSISASLGATASLALAGILSATVLSIAAINNIDTTEGLVLLHEYPDLNFGGILTASVLISTLGALISVSIAITNHIAKIKKSHPDYTFKHLFNRGTSAGKEASSTMVSALIFAYIGIALPLLMLSFSIPFIKFINLGVVITELSAAIVGGLAIVFCSPIASAISAFFFTKFSKQED